MAKFKDIGEITRKVLNEMTKRSNMIELGNEGKRLIQRRTRLGGGVKEHSGNRTKLKALSEPYKKQRKRMKLDSTARPAKSNLTQTGEMLREISVKSIRKSTELYFKTSDAKNKAEWTQDAGRKFFFFSKPEVRQLTKILNEKLLKILKKYNL
jgi:hypothetical protein